MRSQYLPESAWSSFPARTVLEALGEGVSLADVSGRIFYSNSAADEILKVQVSDRPAKGWADHYGVFTPGTEAPFPETEYPLVRALRGDPSDNVEMFVRNQHKPEGVLITVTGRPVRDERGEVVGAAVVFHDITDERRREEELEAAVVRVEQAMKAKDELMRFVVHDLKSPLTALLGLSELLVQDFPEDSEQSQMLRESLHSTRTMHRMIMNLLDVHVAEEGRLEPSVAPTRLGLIVDEAVRMLGFRARMYEITIEVADAAEDPTVLVDAELTRRILVNLLDNSIKYGPKGGRITVEWEPLDGALIVVRVNDEGPGIPREIQEAIFDEFSGVERGFDDVPRAKGSHGLGLRFCKLAAAAQGGRVWVEDNAPTGACFCVALPVSGAAA